MDIDLDELTLEDLCRDGFKMYQRKDGFRFGTDSALLAWFAASFVRERSGGNLKKVTMKPFRALELGAGCGACSLLLLARKKNITVDAVELMEGSYEVLKENIKLNGLGERLNAYNADIREMPQEIKSRQYDLIFMNPPFYRAERGTKASEGDILRLNGRFEENGNLGDFVNAAAARLIPSSGFAVTVMKGNRLNDLMEAYKAAGIAPLRLMTVHPFADREAQMILLAGRRGSSDTELRILPPLILNERGEDGEIRPSKEAQRIYDEEHTDLFV